MEQGRKREDEGVYVERSLDSLIREVQGEYSNGFLCAFDMKGNILYANHKVSLLLKGGSFFDAIPARDRMNIMALFTRVHEERGSGKSVSCFMPLTIGRHQISHLKIRGELVPFAEGLLLKIPEAGLRGVPEYELEKLKKLLLASPDTGLWVTDEIGVIVDCLKENCKHNLGWKEKEVIGRNIATLETRVVDKKEKKYRVDRVHRDGRVVDAEVVHDTIVLSDGKTYHVYLDTYFC